MKNLSMMKNAGKRLGEFIRMLPCGLLTAASLVLLLWLTLSPHPLPEEDIPMFPGVDKVAHMIMFFGVYMVMVTDCVNWRNIHRSGAVSEEKTQATTAMVAACAVICVCLGGAIELLQGWMGAGRSAEWLDFLSDAAGVLSAVVLTGPLVRWIR